jgi:hypothetical protein
LSCKQTKLTSHPVVSAKAFAAYKHTGPIPPAIVDGTTEARRSLFLKGFVLTLK